MTDPTGQNQNMAAGIALEVVRVMTSESQTMDFAAIGEHVGKIMQTISGINAVNPALVRPVTSIFKYLADHKMVTNITKASTVINDIAGLMSADDSWMQRPSPVGHREVGHAVPQTADKSSAAVAPAPHVPTPTLAQPPVLSPSVGASQVEQGPVGKARSKFEMFHGEGNPHLRPISETGQKPAVNVRQSVHPDYIVCLEDGKRMTMLKRHLRSAYGMTPEEYREKWGLPADYPMVAPNYALKKSDYAKKIGLGSMRKKDRGEESVGAHENVAA
jgi:predicted transcriptional regulator